MTQNIGLQPGEIENAAPKVDFESGRRAFMQTLAFGAAGAAIMGASATPALAQSSFNNADILNFALNLEYLEAEFYLTAIGTKLDDADIDGQGPIGPVSRGHAVPFADPLVSKFASELAGHERTHVRYLRGVLGPARVARPAIDVNQAFTVAARAAGLISSTATFDAYANDANFLLASFIFEDVGVTAYKGAAPLLQGAAIIEAAAGILAVEAYHAGVIRTLLYSRGLFTEVAAISNLRDSLDGASDIDKPIGDNNSTVLVPVDVAARAFSRSPRQVLNVVYGSSGAPTTGLFFPSGVNGVVNGLSAGTTSP